MIYYRITPISPESHIFSIVLIIAEPDKCGQVVSLPAWIPGSYMVRDFAKNIVTIAATAEEQPLFVTQLDKQTWRVEATAHPIEITYQVYAWDLSVRTAYLDQNRGYFNGPCLFLKVHGAEAEKCSLELRKPIGERYESWRVATSLKKDDLKSDGWWFYADDYSDLIDHPVEIGVFEKAIFSVGSVKHEIVVAGRHNADLSRICADLQSICEEQKRLFGKLPLDRYLFQVMAVGDGYGGLEHKYSTSLLCNRSDLPTATTKAKEISDDYCRFLGLCSHEYFHLWNVKRIQPAVFVNALLDSEIYTSLLWVFEGITSYYDDLILVRSALISEEKYLELLSHTITRVSRTLGRFKQTLAESSFNAWTKFYKQDENATNAIVSYYCKGALVALSLDLKIRFESGEKYSLDDIMRALWKRYGETGVGVPEDGFESLAKEVTGLDLTVFFDTYIRGLEDPPLEEQLALFGIKLKLRQKKNGTDLGGFVKHATKYESAVSFGVKFTPNVEEAIVQQVFDDGAAQKAGISSGDVLLAIDGVKCTSGNIESLIAQTGSSVDVHLFRRDELLKLSVMPQAAPNDTCELMLNIDATSRMVEARQLWLQSNG